jgi:hypothetical protein
VEEESDQLDFSKPNNRMIPTAFLDLSNAFDSSEYPDDLSGRGMTIHDYNHR